MSLLLLFEKIPDIYNKVCPPEMTLMLRETSKKIKEVMDDMGLEVHIHIKMSNCLKFYILLKNISKNYIITKVEFMKCKTYMFLDLDKIRKLCPSLNYINLCNNSFCFLSLSRFKKNLPKCKVLSCHIRIHPPSSIILNPMRLDVDLFHMRHEPMRLDFNLFHMRLEPMRLDFNLFHMRLEPMILEPMILEPMRLEPMRLEPMRLEPMILEPMILEPMRLEPMRLEPMRLEPMRLDFNFYLFGKNKPMKSLKSQDKTLNKLARRAQYYNTKALNNQYYQKNH
jgi:hypothetical protein